MPAEQLPEGTDTIVTGAGVDAFDEDNADTLDAAAAAMTTSTPPATVGQTDGNKPEPAEPKSLSEHVEGLKGQANDRARAFVAGYKDRATESIDGVVQMIHDAADEVDDKVGAQYGDYIRRAADSVSGLSDALKGKEVDDLFTDARDLIAKAPGVAVGIAAALGFVVARLARAGADVATAATEPNKA